VRFTLRLHNVELENPQINVTPKKDAPVALTWHGKVISTNEPWIAVIIPNGAFAQRRELMGSVQVR
jgi:hypothetical protein